jgi:hypothetical protein
MRRRHPLEVLGAWLATGPVGHLAAGTVDWLAVLRRWAWARARGRDPWQDG